MKNLREAEKDSQFDLLTLQSAGKISNRNTLSKRAFEKESI